MWPFRKKPKPAADYLWYRHDFVKVSEGPRNAFPTKCKNCGGRNINAPEDCSACLKRRRAQEERVMKLEEGKNYQTEVGVYPCKFSHKHNGFKIFIIGGHYYTEDGAAWTFPSMRPRILREVPPPLRLEVGALYETAAGVQRCTHINKMYNQYKVGAHWYHHDGSLGACGDRTVPKILYKLKVNEHMEAKWHTGFDTAGDASDITHYAIYGMRENGDLFLQKVEETKKNMEGLAPQTMRAMRDCLDGILLQREAEKPMPVQYAPHSDCNRREVAVPEGWERVEPRDVIEGDLCDDEGYWKPCGFHLIMTARARGFGGPYIRPIKKPFKVEGEGWYRTRGGGWVKDPLTVRPLRAWEAWWAENGIWLVDGSESGLDLIARATPAQAALLDALRIP